MTKVEQLRKILTRLESGITDKEAKQLFFEDSSGVRIRLSDDGAPDALRARIAAEEEKDS